MSATGLLRRLRTVAFGIATRNAVADYLKTLLVMQFVLLCIAWSIDLAENFPGIRVDAQARGVPIYQLLMPYLSYRTADMMARMLPMACFFAVFLAEFLRRARLETVIFAAAGASPLRLIAPMLIFGALIGGLQYKLESDWRPRAVAAQITLGHGSYAERFRRLWIPNPVWFVSGDTAIRAKILRDESPAMRDVLIFVGLRPPMLRQIYLAEYAEPGETPGRWRLRNAEFWDLEAGREDKVPLGDIDMTLDVIPEQLAYYDMAGFYLPDAPLRAIATMRNAPETSFGADVAIWRRHVAWVVPGMVALLAMLLAQGGYSGRRAHIPRLIALGFAGYLAVISLKVIWSIGELGALPAPVAVCGSLLNIVAICGWLFHRQLGPKAARAAATRG